MNTIITIIVLLVKKTIDADYSPLTKEIESSHEAPQIKLRVRITKYNNIFSKGYTNNWSREITVIDSVLESNTWTYNMKDLSREIMIGSFYEKKLLLIKL